MWLLGDTWPMWHMICDTRHVTPSLPPPSSLHLLPPLETLKLGNLETWKLGNLKTLKPKKCLWQKKNLLKKCGSQKNKGWPNKTFAQTFYLANFFCIKKMSVKTIVGPKHNGENIFFCPKNIFFGKKKYLSKIYCLAKKNCLAKHFFGNKQIVAFFL